MHYSFNDLASIKKAEQRVSFIMKCRVMSTAQVEAMAKAQRSQKTKQPKNRYIHE